MRQSYLILIPSSPASIQLVKSLGKKKHIVGAGPAGSGANVADTSTHTFAMSLTAGPNP